jgi:hypothetical protein
MKINILSLSIPRVILSLSFFLIVSTSAWCDPKSAKQAREKAYIEHFKALKRTKDYSPTAIKKLQQNILVPADKNVQKAQKDDYLSKNPIPKPAKITDRSKDPAFLAKRAKELGDTPNDPSDSEISGIKDDSDGDSNGSGRGGSSSPSYSGSGSSREEVILDGSAVPKELEFTGKPKKTTPQDPKLKR